MLQQTRSASVIPYFERFLARFPDPESLALAPQDELLGLWAGLGYYARARNLQKAARQVIARHGGVVPNDPEAFRALAGVGEYSCGAVMSIAFGLETPILDGNVVRLLCRLHRIAEDPRKAATRKRLWGLSAALVKGERPGDLNQALMEMGAQICTPRAPRCLLCPIREHCQALAAGETDVLPLKATPKPRLLIKRVAALLQTRVGLCLGRRPEEGMLGGLWELPALEAESAEALKRLGLEPGALLAQVEHRFTHRIWKTQIFRAQGEIQAQALSYTRLEFLPEERLPSLGLSGPSLKALRACGFKIPHRRGAGPR